MKTIGNSAKEAMKAHVVDARITWVSNYDTHTIARRLRYKQACGEPITIENFVIDTITLIILSKRKRKH